jgi:hypothetical protein
MKKAILFVMAALVLASSLTLVSCEDENGGNDNKFTGAWTTSNFRTSSSIVPATVVFAGSDWTLTVPSKNITEKGNYSFSSGLNYRVILYQSGSKAGEAMISDSTMHFGLDISGPLRGASGNFTKQQ